MIFYSDCLKLPIRLLDLKLLGRTGFLSTRNAREGCSCAASEQVARLALHTGVYESLGIKPFDNRRVSLALDTQKQKDQIVFLRK